MAGSLPAWERCSHLVSEAASLDDVLRDPELPLSTIEDAHGVIPVEQRAYNKRSENESVRSYNYTTIPIQAVHFGFNRAIAINAHLGSIFYRCFGHIPFILNLSSLFNSGSW